MNELHRDIKQTSTFASHSEPWSLTKGMGNIIFTIFAFIIAPLKTPCGRNRKPLTSCRTSQPVVKFFNDAHPDDLSYLISNIKM